MLHGLLLFLILVIKNGAKPFSACNPSFLPLIYSPQKYARTTIEKRILFFEHYNNNEKISAGI
jgi:hypothetical protein